MLKLWAGMVQQNVSYFEFSCSKTLQMSLSLLEHVLLLVAALQVKHFICDGPLQTLAMVEAKGHYGRPPGLLHSFIHAIGTMLVLAGFGFSAFLALLLGVLDFAVHYHVDFAKENVVRRAGWKPSHAYFWWALSADQMAHQLTYLLITYIAVKA